LKGAKPRPHLFAQTDVTGSQNVRKNCCATTICEVLVRLIDWLGTNGTFNGKAYVTCTFTIFPGELHVPDAHAAHVVAVLVPPVVVVAVSHVVLTVI
jgi:hypothetical protein